MSMLNAYAIGTVGQALVEFAENNVTSDDWSCQDITAMVTGTEFNNVSSEEPIVYVNNRPSINNEMIVHLQGGDGKCTIPLATALAFAARYCAMKKASAEAIANRPHFSLQDLTDKPVQ